MIYQKIFGADAPFKITYGSLAEFPEHRHGDLEFNFALEGGFEIMIEKRLFRVPEGSMTFIHSMEAHAVPPSDSERRVVTVIVGTALLKKHFAEFSRAAFPETVYDLSEYPEIKELFSACANGMHPSGVGDTLVLEGCIYKLLGNIFDSLAISAGKEKTVGETDLSKVENIERAFDLIYYNYKDPITVEDAARLTGYSKSNFCKIFKLTVGEGFHQALNRQRVSNAAAMLRASGASVADIASEVGFTETKSFCRVFKSIMGVTPGQYRRNEQSGKV
jgi:AraC-like DNA-binding protein